MFRFVVGFGRFRRKLVCGVHQLGFDVSGGFAADLLRLTGTKDHQNLPGSRDIVFDGRCNEAERSNSPSALLNRSGAGRVASVL